MNRVLFTIFLSCFFTLTPPSLAYRNGAQQESCYDHRINHPGDFNPTSAKQTCTHYACRYNFDLIGEVNESLFLVDTEVVKTRVLNCGSVYRCKLTVDA